MHYKNINWRKEIKDASDVALLKTPAMHSISQDKQKTQLGYCIIIISGILSLIGNQLYPVFSIFRPSLSYGIYMAATQIISTILGIYVISFIAKTFFKGGGNHDEFFRVAAYGTIVMWLGLIPHLSFIAGIWGLVIMFMVLKTVHKLSTGGAVGTLIAAIVIGMIVGGILFPARSRIMWSNADATGANYLDVASKGFKINTGDGGMEMKNNKVKITTNDGKSIEYEIPNIKND